MQNASWGISFLVTTMCRTLAGSSLDVTEGRVLAGCLLVTARDSFFQSIILLELGVSYWHRCRWTISSRHALASPLTLAPARGGVQKPQHPLRGSAAVPALAPQGPFVRLMHVTASHTLASPLTLAPARGGVQGPQHLLKASAAVPALAPQGPFVRLMHVTASHTLTSPLTLPSATGGVPGHQHPHAGPQGLSSGAHRRLILCRPF